LHHHHHHNEEVVMAATAAKVKENDQMAKVIAQEGMKERLYEKPNIAFDLPEQ